MTTTTGPVGACDAPTIGQDGFTRADAERELRQLMQAAKRECGTCNLCCFTHLVAAEPARDFPAKPEMQWCSDCVNATNGCCLRYETRPDACVGFACGWVLGFLPDEANPTHTKVVIDLEPRPLITDGREVVTWRAFEAAGGALDAPWVKSWRNEAASRGFAVLFVRIDGKRTLYWPEPEWPDDLAEGFKGDPWLSTFRICTAKSITKKKAG